MTNKCVKELVGFINVFQIYPNMFRQVRPRTRWADVVQRDALQLLGVRGWRRRAEDRDEWRHAMREAKARKGL
jgi:hypothetical protein